MFWRQRCTHTDQIREDVVPSAQGCEECLFCGHIGCCDESKNKHATKHFHYTGHPIIRSFESGEDWRYCYLDDVLV
jgi:uncharacterized UBP type Zn finger protein